MLLSMLKPFFLVKVEISVPWVEPNKSIRGELYYLLHLLFIHSKVRCGSESKIRVFVAI